MNTLTNKMLPKYPSMGNRLNRLWCMLGFFSRVLWHCGLQLSRFHFPSLSPRACSNSWWCSLTISSSAALFFFCLLPFLAWGSFPMSWLFTSGGQSIGASASASALPVNIQDWFPLGLIDLLAVQVTLKSLLQYHNLKASILPCFNLFMVQLSHLCMPAGKKNHSFDYTDLCQQNYVSTF